MLLVQLLDHLQEEGKEPTRSYVLLLIANTERCSAIYLYSEN